MTPERFSRIQAVLNRRQPDLTVITDEVHKGRNLSAIIRTCDAVGISQFHCVEPKSGYRAYRGTALGSNKWVETILHQNVSQAILSLKQSGFQVVAANLSDRAVDFRQVDYTSPTALLMGTEKEGVSHEALRLVDKEVVIPMMGMVESFNVSAACSIILTEAQWQRQNAGLYDSRRLSEDVYQKQLFRWCQPTLTEYCDSHGFDYPPLDDEGDVIDPSAWYQSMRALEKDSKG